MTRTTEAPALTDDEAVVVRFIEVMAHGDYDDLRVLSHPDGTNREARIEPPACRGRGPDAYWATVLWLRGMFSELRWEIHDVLSARDLVVLHCTMYARHTGTYTRYDDTGELDVSRPATGRSFSSAQTHWFRVRDGMVIDHWANRDDLGTATQLGFLGPPPAGPEC